MARAVAALLAVAAVATGCAVGPSTRPPVAVRGVVPAPGVTATLPAPPSVPEPDGQRAVLGFSDCTADTVAGASSLRAECASLRVPADPAQPGLGAVTLDVIRVGPADGLSTRPPLLLLGDTSLDPAARRVARIARTLPADVLGRYTLVGLDRRGGGDDRLDCATTATRSALVDADPASFDASALLETARDVVQNCNTTLDDQLGAFSAAAGARDVEQLRRGLGVLRLSAVGSGDATNVLATWAVTTPRSVGRLVLDGPTSPGLDEPDRAEGRARGAEAAFDAFALACTGRGGCPLGADPRRAVTALLAALRTRPLVAADGNTLSAGGAVTAVRLGLGEPDAWPGLATALAAAAAGDPGPLLDRLAPFVGPQGTFDAALATDCNDARRRLAPAEIRDLATRWRQRYPLFGGSAALGLVDCAPWSTGGAPPAVAAPDGLSPALVIGTAADPRGTQEGARLAADALPGAVYVAWQGAGTGAYPRSGCVNGVVGDLLLKGMLPRPDVTCPP